MSRGIGVHQRVHAHIDASRFSQQAWNLRADGPVDAVHLGVGAENLQKSGLGGVRRIAALRRRVSLMQGDDTARSDEADHLGDDLLRFPHVDEDQARRCEVEASRCKTRAASTSTAPASTSNGAENHG